MLGIPLPSTRRGQVHSYYFKVQSPQEGLVKTMGPYPDIRMAIAAREALRSAGYQVGANIAND